MKSGHILCKLSCIDFCKMGKEWTPWPPHLSVRLTSHCCRAHQERKRTRFAPYGCYVMSFYSRPPHVRKNPKMPTVQRHAPVSQLDVKQYRVPLKTSDKKPIWSPSSNHQFLLQKQPLHFCLSECYSSTGGKKIENKAKTEEMWQFNGHFHGEGETGAKGVVLGLLGASKRWIKMVGYRGAQHFCLFFVSSWSLANLGYLAGRSNLPHFCLVMCSHLWLSYVYFVLCIICGWSL